MIDAATIRRLTLLTVVAIATAAVLSVLFSVPYIYTAIGFATWLFGGHLITIDDDFPGGWSNPDGIHPIPWWSLAVKGIVLFALLGLAAVSPAVRQYGG